VGAFALDADTTHPPDFALLRAGGMALFRRPNVLREAEQELGGLGYDLARLEASSWTESDLHDAFASTLSFPGYYGRNLNALADCLYDVAHGDYGWAPTSTGLAVTVDGFGNFAEREPDLAHALAQGLVEATRVFGKPKPKTAALDQEEGLRAGPTRSLAISGPRRPVRSIDAPLGTPRRPTPLVGRQSDPGSPRSKSRPREWRRPVAGACPLLG